MKPRTNKTRRTKRRMNKKSTYRGGMEGAAAVAAPKPVLDPLVQDPGPEPPPAPIRDSGIHISLERAKEMKPADIESMDEDTIRNLPQDVRDVLINKLLVSGQYNELMEKIRDLKAVSTGGRYRRKSRGTKRRQSKRRQSKSRRSRRQSRRS